MNAAIGKAKPVALAASESDLSSEEKARRFSRATELLRLWLDRRTLAQVQTEQACTSHTPQAREIQ